MSRDLPRILALLRSGSRFLITSHVNPDGDSVASQCALRLLLRQLGKRAVIFNSHAVPRAYRFLPGAARIRQRAPRTLRRFDALLVLDCGDPRRASGLLRRRTPVPVVNIDHHLTNPRFGDLNWIVPTASSVAEVIYRLAELLGVKPSGPLAEAIYAGILADTGSFRQGNATPRTFLVASRLVRSGIDPAHIAQAIYETVEFETLRVLGERLGRLRRTGDGRIAWLSLPLRSLRRLPSPDASEEWVRFPRSVATARIAVCFKEIRPREIRLSFRSKGDVDVAALALRWGGGGHRNAAGATFRGPLARAEREVIAAAAWHLDHPHQPASPAAPQGGRQACISV